MALTLRLLGGLSTAQIARSFLVPEALGLLALMLLTDARRAARTGAGGELIPLGEQDRGRWDHDQIAEGQSLGRTCLRCNRPGCTGRSRWPRWPARAGQACQAAIDGTQNAAERAFLDRRRRALTPPG